MVKAFLFNNIFIFKTDLIFWWTKFFGKNFYVLKTLNVIIMMTVYFEKHMLKLHITPEEKMI